MYINSLIAASILAFTAGVSAWTEAEQYGLFAREAEADFYEPSYLDEAQLFSREADHYDQELSYDDFQLFGREAQDGPLEFDIDYLHPRDAYALGMEDGALFVREPAAPKAKKHDYNGRHKGLGVKPKGHKAVAAAKAAAAKAKAATKRKLAGQNRDKKAMNELTSSSTKLASLQAQERKERGDIAGARKELLN